MATGYRKVNNRIARYNNRVITGSEPIIIQIAGETFPPSVYYSSTVNTGVGNLVLSFNVPTIVKVDFDDGTTGYYQSYYLNANSPNAFIFCSNTYFTDLTDIFPIHYYTGNDISRVKEVKISFLKSNLTLWNNGITNISGLIPQSLNFNWSKCPNLVTFVNSLSFVTSLNLEGLTNNTNPKLKAFDFRLFHSSSEFYSKLPEDLLSLTLTRITFGNTNWQTSIASGTSNLDKLATNDIANTLEEIIFSSIAETDMQADNLPSNFSQLTNLKTYQNYGSKCTHFHSAIENITSLERVNWWGTSYLTSYCNFTNLVNLKYLEWRNSENLYLIPFPESLSNCIQLSIISYYLSNDLDDATKTAALIGHVYDFITTYATIDGIANSYFRGMNLSLNNGASATAITPANIIAPTDYVQGSNNGTPNNAEEKLYVLINQYETNLTYSI